MVSRFAARQPLVLGQVTTTKSYKQAFTANQVVRVCDQYNPFFGICEKARIEP